MDSADEILQRPDVLFQRLETASTDPPPYRRVRTAIDVEVAKLQIAIAEKNARTADLAAGKLASATKTLSWVTGGPVVATVVLVLVTALHH